MSPQNLMEAKADRVPPTTRTQAKMDSIEYILGMRSLVNMLCLTSNDKPSVVEKNLLKAFKNDKTFRMSTPYICFDAFWIEMSRNDTNSMWTGKLRAVDVDVEVDYEGHQSGSATEYEVSPSNLSRREQMMVLKIIKRFNRCSMASCA